MTDMKTAEQLNEERKYQKPKEELNHIWNIDYILKCLFKMNEGDQWPYFEAYGREFIQNLVDQQVTAATAELKRERDEYYDTLQQHRLTISELQARIKELEEQVTKWISVEEKLPKIGVSVLMLMPNGDIKIGFYIGNDRWDTFYQKRLISITHWMPLPKPLK